MPWIIADTVCGEVSRFLGVEIPARYSDWLDAKAERCYARHDHFRKLMRGRGNAPRDWLYAFMRHWLAAMLDLERPDLYQCLPEDFNLGHRLPTGQHPLIRRKGFVPTLLPKSRPWNARRVICVIPLFPILAGVHIRCGRRVGNHNRPKGHGGLIRFPDRTQPVGSRT
jgi:hypothetical protein